MKWSEIHIIAETLYDLHEDKHPLSVRFTDLHGWITQLDEFDDDPEGSSEGILESIQMLWYEEWKMDHDPSEDPYVH